MGLAIENRKVTSKLYDKRDAFSFSVVRLPFKCSNIPSKMFYATIGAEVLRIGKATSKYDFFPPKCAHFTIEDEKTRRRRIWN